MSERLFQAQRLLNLSPMTLTVISGSAKPSLAASIAHVLGVTPCRRTLQLQRFANGELHVEIEESVGGHDVYIVQPTSPPPDEHLM